MIDTIYMPTVTRDGFVLFWRPDSVFSQWHPATFVVGGRTFGCAEQFMMHGKAVLFGDAAIAEAILAAASPREHKALGRKVKGFDDARWRAAREGIVYAGSEAKFTQNPAMLAALLATAPARLVEASPMDRIWGIGMSSASPDATRPEKWRGQNLLGGILTRLRDALAARP
jgi:ribA/ribD-fused uncharacterized protein